MTDIVDGFIVILTLFVFFFITFMSLIFSLVFVALLQKFSKLDERQIVFGSIAGISLSVFFLIIVLENIKFFGIIGSVETLSNR